MTISGRLVYKKVRNKSYLRNSDSKITYLHTYSVCWSYNSLNMSDDYAGLGNSQINRMIT